MYIIRNVKSIPKAYIGRVASAAYGTRANIRQSLRNQIENSVSNLIMLEYGAPGWIPHLGKLKTKTEDSTEVCKKISDECMKTNLRRSVKGTSSHNPKVDNRWGI